MASILESVTDNAEQAFEVSIHFQRMLTVPIISTEDSSHELLLAQAHRMFQSHLLTRQLVLGRIDWVDYLDGLENLGIDTESLTNLWHNGIYLV